jgi:hypothetical protein
MHAHIRPKQIVSKSAAVHSTGLRPPLDPRRNQ